MIFDQQYYDEYIYCNGPLKGYDNYGWPSIADDIIKQFTFETFLDVGCGTGNLVAEMNKRGKQALGFDVSEYAVDKANSKNVIIHDVTQPFPYKDKQFDLVRCYGVLEHFKSKEEVISAMKEVDRVGKQILFGCRLWVDRYMKDDRVNPDLDLKDEAFWNGLWSEAGITSVNWVK